jgi:hypothetical protein
VPAAISDGPDSWISRYLRSLDSKVDRIGADVREIKGRLRGLEECYASVFRCLDSLETRLERIERRFDLMDTPYPPNDRKSPIHAIEIAQGIC